MQKVFICSPYRGDIEHNIEVARYAGHIAAVTGYVPVIPHLLYPQFLDDNSPDERILGIKLGAELLKASDMMWLIGTKITKGMKYELEIVNAISKCRFSPKWDVVFYRAAYRCYTALYTTSLAGLKPVKP